MAVVWLLLGCSLDMPPAGVPLAQRTSSDPANPSTVASMVPSPPLTVEADPTIAPTTQPTRTPEPTPTTTEPPETPSDAPTPSVLPEANMGYRDTPFGLGDDARFSTRLESVNAERLDQIDRLTLNSPTQAVRCMDWRPVSKHSAGTTWRGQTATCSWLTILALISTIGHTMRRGTHRRWVKLRHHRSRFVRARQFRRRPAQFAGNARRYWTASYAGFSRRCGRTAVADHRGS